MCILRLVKLEKVRYGNLKKRMQVPSDGLESTERVVDNTFILFLKAIFFLCEIIENFSMQFFLYYVLSLFYYGSPRPP